jgi:hypothetical protein
MPVVLETNIKVILNEFYEISWKANPAQQNKHTFIA